MFVLVTYDIENDKLRTKVADVLERHGRRVQWSVFECHLTPKQYEALKGQLADLVEPRGAGTPEPPGTHSIRFYRLCKACTGRFEVLGEGELSRDKAFYMV